MSAEKWRRRDREGSVVPTLKLTPMARRPILDLKISRRFSVQILSLGSLNRERNVVIGMGSPIRRDTEKASRVVGYT